MGQSVLYSAVLHSIVLLALIFGLPSWFLETDFSAVEETMVVEVVNPDLTNNTSSLSEEGKSLRHDGLQLNETITEFKKLEQMEKIAQSPRQTETHHKPLVSNVTFQQAIKRSIPTVPVTVSKPLGQEKSKQETQDNNRERKIPAAATVESQLLTTAMHTGQTKVVNVSSVQKRKQEKLQPSTPLPRTTTKNIPGESKDRERKSDSFESVLKSLDYSPSVEKIEGKRENRQLKSVMTGNQNLAEKVEQSTMIGHKSQTRKTTAMLSDSGGATQHQLDSPLNSSEIDSIRAQVERCWNVPTVIPHDSKNLTLELKVQLASDGQVLNVQIIENTRYSSDHLYRAVVDSARRAVYRCSPIRAPLEKYERWRDIKLRFNLHEMLGL